jgi:hypothetical protein
MTQPKTSLPGRRIGAWTVIGESPRYRGSSLYWLCRCECGTTKEVAGGSLRNGISRSCGCLRSDFISQTQRSHRVRKRTRADVWRSLDWRGLPNPEVRPSIWARVMPEPNSGCWLWLGDVTDGGYGKVFVRGRTVLVHRLFLSLVTELIPGLTVDHKCVTACCVNPAHLQQVTPSKNSALRQERNRACAHGHEWTAENTRWAVGSSGHTTRWCRKCDVRRQREHRQRRKHREVQP